MDSIKNTLDHRVFVTPSGIEHAYFGVKSEKMFTRITSHPPLGHDTVVSARNLGVTFNVLVETDFSKDAQDWEVQLWHNLHDPLKWEGSKLEETKARLAVTQTKHASSLRRIWFTTTLKGTSSPFRPVSFTLKFRARPDDAWRWVQNQSGTRDGRLLYQPSDVQGMELSDYINDISSELDIKSEHSETPETQLWSLKMKAKPAQGEESGFSECTLGLPTDFVRWFSLVRLWSPWLAPRHGTKASLAEKDGVLYSFLRDDGMHVVALAISGIDDVLTTFKANQHKLVVSARNDREEEGTARIAVAVGRTFDDANAAVMYFARKIVSDHNAISTELEAVMQDLQNKNEEGDVHASWIQNWADEFCFCTWNALGQNLTEDKITEALESLKKDNINIVNLIIDDNWQDLNHEGESQMVRQWRSFEANSKGFPQGLKSAIAKIRKNNPHIKHIGVWHALLGYWGGIDPKGELGRKYKTIEVQKRDNVVGGKFTVIDAPDVPRFYNDFYDFLSSTGVDSVKTDAQFFLDEISSAPARRSLTTTYLNSWMTSQLRHFSGRAISCMSQTPTILFHSQLPQHLPALTVRNNDDFFPHVEASHPWHIFCNAHNSLFTKHLNVLPDWDMFQTSHAWAGFHAAARAVSGGPIYITDEPGKHDVALIKQFTAVTPREQTIILRPSVVGRSAHTYIGFEEDRLCLVAAYHGRSGSDGSGSFLGLFNCKDEELAEVVPLTNFLGTDNDGEYIVRSHRTGEVSRVMGVKDRNADEAVMAVEIAGRGWEILAATPVHTVTNHNIQISNLGLVGKMTGAAAILSTTVRLDKSDARVRIGTTMKALGVWGLWISTLAHLNIEKDFMVLLEGKVVSMERTRKSTTCECVLEVDIEGAWRDMGLKAGWSNEVGVEVFINTKKDKSVNGMGN